MSYTSNVKPLSAHPVTPGGLQTATPPLPPPPYMNLGNFLSWFGTGNAESKQAHLCVPALRCPPATPHLPAGLAPDVGHVLLGLAVKVPLVVGGRPGALPADLPPPKGHPLPPLLLVQLVQRKDLHRKQRSLQVRMLLAATFHTLQSSSWGNGRASLLQHSSLRDLAWGIVDMR